MLVVSPHLDDAVLSVGQVIGAQLDVTVMTIFGGMPSSSDMLTAYDKACGFGSSREAVLVRRREEMRAMNVLGSESVVHDFPDHQYGVDVEEMREEIRDCIRVVARESDVVLVPLGISHPDHLIVAAESLEAVRGHGAAFVYEEQPYRVQFPEQVAATLAVREHDGWELHLDDSFNRSIIEIKSAAVECYRSQLSPEMRRWCLTPERLWRLSHA